MHGMQLDMHAMQIHMHAMQIDMHTTRHACNMQLDLST
jgi:hypothetical protein